MHSFQPYPIEQLEINPFNSIGKEWLLITAGDKDRDNLEKVNTMTASWGGLGVLWGENVVFIFVRESRYTKEFIDSSETFSITFLDITKHKMTLKYLGSVSGKDEDKIKNARLNVNYHENTPFIDEGYLSIICKKMAKVPITKDTFINPAIDVNWYKDNDYHTMYVGSISEILAR